VVFNPITETDIPSMMLVGHDGSVVRSVPCVRRVADSNATLAPTQGPRASPSLAVLR